MGLRSTISNSILEQLLHFSKLFLENKTQRSICKIKRRFQNELSDPAPKVRLTYNLKLIPKTFVKIFNLINLAKCREHDQRITISHLLEHGITVPPPAQYLKKLIDMFQQIRKSPFNTLVCATTKEDEERKLNNILIKIHSVI
eukprot:TRINITY_DN5418_c0_g1_i2.p1 TRINITY_DN5418_c0_g1~~TRINITY_DN5418_c0_g1_i2.p1  ORF type:complete len:143 (-),score=2.82 TRINITY_DN5418_c0_g1_i2:126-554(-)